MRGRKPAGGRGGGKRKERVEEWGSDTASVASASSAGLSSGKGPRKYSREQLRAIKRLVKDLSELATTPIPQVSAAPVGDDLFLWHGNLRGPAGSPFDGGVFHIVLRFPDTYPDAPPSVTLCNEISSPFVLPGNRLCLDMLDDGGRVAPGAGWTPAYSVQSVLLQLQSFLLDGLEASKVRPGYSVSFSQKQTSGWKQAFDDKDTTGDGTLRPEDVRELMLEVGERKPTVAELALYYRMLDLPSDQPIEFSTFLSILQRKREFRKEVETANRFVCSHPQCKHAPQRPFPAFLSPQDSDFLLKVPETERLRAETVCFYSRKSFLPPEEATLGVGISIVTHFRTGKVFSASSPLDILSIDAFRKMRVRRSADNSSTFTHWMPLYICPEHAARAMHLAERALGIIVGGTHSNFKPEYALDFFPRIINGLVFELHKAPLYKTVRALRGYLSFWRLFAAFAEKFPEVRQMAEETVRKLISDPAALAKANVQVLADILPLFSITETPISAILESFLLENDARNVLFLTKKAPELAKQTPDPKLDRDRPAKTFDVCRVSYRLLMLHHFFITRIIKGPSVAAGSKAAGSLAQLLDSRYGQPTHEMLERLQQGFRAIMSIEDYAGLYKQLGIPQVSHEEIVARLLRAVRLSKERHYHGERVLNVRTPEDYQREQLAEFNSLEALVVKEPSSAAAASSSSSSSSAAAVVAVTPSLIDDEGKWQSMCKIRFGKDAAEAPLQPGETYRMRYLRANLEDMLSKLNENPDFKRLYRVLDLSAAYIKELEHTVIPTTELRSKHHYLTAILGRLFHLERFTLRRGEMPLGPNGSRSLAKGLEKSHSLRALDLRYTNFELEAFRALMMGLEKSHSLLSLNLEGNNLQHGAEFIADVLKSRGMGLVTLKCDHCHLTNTGAAELARAFYHSSTLRHLSLSKNQFTAGGAARVFDTLAYSPVIETVDLSYTNLSGDNAGSSAENERKELQAALQKLFLATTTLREINLYRAQIGNSLTQAVLHALAHNRSITSLDLSRCNVGDACCHSLGKALARNRNIVRFMLEDNPITIAGLVELSRGIHDDERAIKRRAEAKAKQGRLTQADEEEELAPRGCSLVEFSMSGCHLKMSDAPENEEIALTRLISKTTTLRTLDFSQCHFGVGAGKPIGFALKGHPSLHTLLLPGNGLGEHGVRHLAMGLSENTVLKKLDISHNGIGGRGAKYVEQVLASKSALEELNIFGNLIGIEGARCIATGLQANHVLRMLDLGLNRIRSKGASAIAAALAERRPTQTLQVLKLKLNFLGDRSALEIAHAISGKPSLAPQHHDGDGAGTSSAAAAAAAIACQFPLQKLSLSGNKISVATLQRIIDGITPTALDVAEHVRVTADPSRLLRTVLCTPLPMDVTEQQLRKLFYEAKCGAIASICIHKVKVSRGQRKPAFGEAKFAFVEFADLDSVDVALDLGEHKRARIGHKEIRVIQCRFRETTDGAKKKRKAAARGHARPPPPMARRGRKPARR